MFFTFLRVTSFFTSSNILFPSGTPQQFKIVFCLLFSILISSTLNIEIQVENEYIFLTYATMEVLTGLFLGYITSICFNVVKIAGKLIDQQMGLSMASIYDPQTLTQTTLIENMLYWLSVMIFFSINGHHVLIEGIIHSFNIIEIGDSIISNNFDYILKIFIEYFIIGFQMSAPVVLALLISEIIMGLVSRSVPQFNVMLIGAPLKLLVGMIFILTALPFISKEMHNIFGALSSILLGTFSPR